MGKAKDTAAGQGFVVIAEDICKGCALCTSACPVKVLAMGKQLNVHGYHFARYAGAGCTACGICFYFCPEPGAITVFKGPRTHAAQEGKRVEATY